eukprot:scaffold3828_cov260-Ochromonas_danica.AAC.1
MSEEERLWASSGVQKVVSSQGAFAALRQDGSVLSWGHGGYGGDMSSVSWLLGGGVVELHGGQLSFMAVRSDGLLVGWGNNGVFVDGSSVSSLSVSSASSMKWDDLM